jgi:hypothetical protein
MTDAQLSCKPSSRKPEPSNGLARRFRKWHSVLGAFAAFFLAVVGLTGIFLNHKLFFSRLLAGDPADSPKVASARQKDGSSESGLWLEDIAGLPVGFDRALNLAAEHWGKPRIEKIELKDEKGELIYKVKQPDGLELLISATTGAIVERGHYEKLGMPGPDGQRARSFDWGKLMLDLHTGKIVGEPGRYASTAVSLVLLTLTWTGVWLWLKPKLKPRTAGASPKTNFEPFPPAAASYPTATSRLT